VPRANRRSGDQEIILLVSRCASRAKSKTGDLEIRISTLCVGDQERTEEQDRPPDLVISCSLLAGEAQRDRERRIYRTVAVTICQSLP
jgi:hypothetical protein